MRSTLRPSLACLAAQLLAGATLVACSPGGDSAATSTGSGSDDGSGGGVGGGPGSGGESHAGPAVTSGPGSGGGSSSSSGQGGEGAGAPCEAGTILCEGTTRKVCDGNGGYSEEEACDPGVCIANLGCTLCAPGSGSCEGNVSTVCNAAGSGFTTYTCDPEQGVTCNAGTGHCEGPCSPELLGSSYVGCDYYPTVTLNSLLGASFNAEGTFALAVANTTDQPAAVKVHRGASLVVNTSVAANSVQIVTLPWVYELKNAGNTQVLADGAYRLRTNRPVTVYQYNPIEYQTSGGNTYTNDASVLLPVNAWTGTYRVAARNSWSAYSGFYAVTASQDATTVTLTPSATGNSVKVGGGLAATGTGTVVLNEGDVLQVLSTSNGAQQQAVDLTGTLVSADKPVQVIGGHDCTNVPATVTACDHLEESMPPVETLATEYIVTPPLIPTGGSTPKGQMVRVIATEAATTISYDPPQAGAPTFLANAGDHFEIAATVADFVVSADKPVMVSQTMQGQSAGGGSGDPAMTLAVATEQYRQQYLFHAPTNYSTNYVNVTAPTAATVTLDGAPIAGFVPIGASGYGIARVALSNSGDGNHRMTSNQPFGISVYGYGQYTSYWYPGGLDLDKLGTE